MYTYLYSIVILTCTVVLQCNILIIIYNTSCRILAGDSGFAGLFHFNVTEQYLKTPLDRLFEMNKNLRLFFSIKKIPKTGLPFFRLSSWNGRHLFDRDTATVSCNIITVKHSVNPEMHTVMHIHTYSVLCRYPCMWVYIRIVCIFFF